MSDSEKKVALYRKYRPTNFSEVKDQEHIISVLEGAIKKEQIPHALLFTGTRGTGKTTLARLFAKAIGVKEVDMYEIDAASNRGIDDIRALREAVQTLPYESKYKVYIVDEVHMLTKEAFNALLKTLEEPPAHIVFILATTEEEKVPDTILSRCHVFRTKSPSRQVIAQMVKDVAAKESFTMSEESADLVATAADGSFRDALGIAEKVILGSSDQEADTDEVAQIIGAPSTSLLFSVVKALHEKDCASGLEAVAKAKERNIDMKLFVQLLMGKVRQVMLMRHAKAGQPVSAEIESESTTLEEYSSASKSGLNSHLLRRLLAVASETRTSSLQYLPLEIVFMEFNESDV